jgi:hypothetical protein
MRILLFAFALGLAACAGDPGPPATPYQQAQRACLGGALLNGVPITRAYAACSGAGAALGHTATCQNVGGGIVSCSTD